MPITVKIFHPLIKTICALQFLILWFMVTISSTDEFSWNNDLWFSCRTDIYSGTLPYGHLSNTVTSLLWPLFLAACQNGLSFSCEKTLINTVTRLIQPIFLGLLVTLFTGFHCNYFFVLCRDRKIVPKGLCGSWKNLIWYFELWKRSICNESLLCDIFLWRFHLAVFKSLLPLAKKVVSDSPGLADFAIRLVNSVFKLPDQQVMFFEEFESQKNCETDSVSQNAFGASWNDIWASKC